VEAKGAGWDDEVVFSFKFPVLMTVLLDRCFLGIAAVDLGDDEGRIRGSGLFGRSRVAVVVLELAIRDA